MRKTRFLILLPWLVLLMGEVVAMWFITPVLRVLLSLQIIGTILAIAAENEYLCIKS